MSETSTINNRNGPKNDHNRMDWTTTDLLWVRARIKGIELES